MPAEHLPTRAYIGAKLAKDTLIDIVVTAARA